MNDTSASRGVSARGRCQRCSTCDTMFWRYSGYGNSMPAVLTVATSLPVLGVSPGSGFAADDVRGAASRLRVSDTGGGTAFETVFEGGGRLVGGAGAGGAASRCTASGALRVS